MLRELKLIEPTDPRVQSAIAPFSDDMLKQHDFKDRKELSMLMFEAMYRYGGMGLSANQVGLPFRMFVMGGHPEIEKGRKLTVFNPIITDWSEEQILLREGCLSFPFVYLSIKRPKKIKAKFEDESGLPMKAELDGYFSRIFQHEYDHMLGKVFIEYASKLKLDLAYKAAYKKIDLMKKRRKEANG